MSLLYPLFLAGIAAVVLPILLHMIRRHTRQRVPFSSLMFLRPSLPRFQSRSRLEHVLLLLVRCAVLCLLAFAFARPFLRQPAATNSVEASQRVVLLLDTSASMRRAGLWPRALDEVKLVLKEAGPADRVCVMSFDQTTRTLIGFEQWQTLEPGQRVPLATQEIARLAPGWSATDLGHALVTAAEAIEDDESNDGQQSRAARRIVLVSDVQQGSKLDALRTYEWPQRTELVVKALPCQGATNAALQLVTNRDALAPARDEELPDIRITNSPDATNDRFQLQWAGGTESAPSVAMDVYVASGHSTVVRAPARPTGQATATLVLTGDDQDFDNTLYVMPELRRQITVLYVGNDDPNDTTAMLYYLRQAFGTGKAVTAHVTHHPVGTVLSPADLDGVHLIVVTHSLEQQNIASLRRYLESGRPLLLALKSAETAATLSALASVGRIEAQEAETSRYAMLGRLEFDHPLLKPFSDPRFGDFTRIHFWKHRRVNLTNCPGARVLARFDDNDPAWFEVPVARGTILVWTSGWQPADSDLALSSKFVPLLYSTLESGGTLIEQRSQYFVGDAVPLPSPGLSGGADIQIRKPDGTIARLDKNQQTFTQTDLPGVYSIEGSAPAADPRFFAVNLPVAESRTDPLPVEDLEKLGVTLKPMTAAVSEAAQRVARHNSFTEMESHQKLWRWVLVATLALLLMEIWLGGRLTRPSPATEREPT